MAVGQQGWEVDGHKVPGHPAPLLALPARLRAWHSTCLLSSGGRFQVGKVPPTSQRSGPGPGGQHSLPEITAVPGSQPLCPPCLGWAGVWGLPPASPPSPHAGSAWPWDPRSSRFPGSGVWEVMEELGMLAF